MLAGLGFLVYRFQGRRQILKFDIVQFLYAFIFAPLLFIWVKTFLYVVIRDQIGLTLSPGQVFALDTIMSVFFLYLYGFVVLHSLTKTFRLQNDKDPLYDIFWHSEYYHLWITHIIMSVGGMAVICLLGVVNLFVPLQIYSSVMSLLLMLVAGVMSGFLVYMSILLADPKQERRAGYMRLMKLAFGGFFSINLLLYLIFSPSFSMSYGLFWWNFLVFAVATLLGFLSYKSSSVQILLDSMLNYFKHFKWGINMDLIKQSSKNEKG